MKTFDPNYKLLDEAVCGINDLQEEFDENDSEIETVARNVSRQLWPTFWSGSAFRLILRRPSGNGIGEPHVRKRTGRL